jgi:hypothetical protein
MEAIAHTEPRKTIWTAGAHVSDDDLTAHLAERILGWRIAPNRFIQSGRKWIPRWRFQPFANLEDAFRLLDTAASSYTLRASSDATFTAEVCVASRNGRASGKSKATIITVAVARAIGLDVPDGGLEMKKR